MSEYPFCFCVCVFILMLLLRHFQNQLSVKPMSSWKDELGIWYNFFSDGLICTFGAWIPEKRHFNFSICILLAELLFLCVGCVYAAYIIQLRKGNHLTGRNWETIQAECQKNFLTMSYTVKYFAKENRSVWSTNWVWAKSWKMSCRNQVFCITLWPGILLSPNHG